MAALSVLNPVGFPPKVTRQTLAPRLDTLEGKTVYLVDCRFDDSDIFLGQMQAWFAEALPGVRTVVKRISSVYLHDDPTTWEEIKSRGHAAILGVGRLVKSLANGHDLTVTTGSYCGMIDVPLDTPLTVQFGTLGVIDVEFHRFEG